MMMIRRKRKRYLFMKKKGGMSGIGIFFTTWFVFIQKRWTYVVCISNYIIRCIASYHRIFYRVELSIILRVRFYSSSKVLVWSSLSYSWFDCACNWLRWSIALS
jgi:hypothetical protein